MDEKEAIRKAQAKKEAIRKAQAKKEAMREAQAQEAKVLASKQWDIDRLLIDLAKTGENLPKSSIHYLCLLLAGYEQKEIAKRLCYKTVGEMRITAISKPQLHRCIENTTGVPSDTIKHFWELKDVLKKTGYDKASVKLTLEVRGDIDSLIKRAMNPQELNLVNFNVQDIDFISLFSTLLQNIDPSIKIVRHTDD